MVSPPYRFTYKFTCRGAGCWTKIDSVRHNHPSRYPRWPDYRPQTPIGYTIYLSYRQTTSTDYTLLRMTLDQINSRLQAILTNIGVSFSAFTEQAHFNRDLGLDSLDVTDLLVQVEDSFSIRIPDDVWWKLKTVGQLTNYLVEETALD